MLLQLSFGACAAIEQLCPYYISKLKLHLCMPTAVPTALYACEASKLATRITKAQGLSLQMHQIIIIRVPCIDQVSNEELTKRSGLENIMDIVDHRSWTCDATTNHQFKPSKEWR